ncbi:LacI family transcriptional regulator [Rathayibacter sp. AY1F3]|uniref:LacI family DNA-binding transcriptional regulator n=1 Tax=Rathayibacter sp. AY1F3 TaxID=2080558 RepID=UPI000CE8779E|nr:LacI family DNA-binding transcriptional regulator [Rathayibacter sp. AY1F3]PPG92933.1 LacI family transcriptional regulator [Rathayibacter sp. AY1F3]
MAGRTATMRQVAERAGVSQATVSLVLNNAPGNRVTEATRARVMEAVDDLGYRTNAFAKSLRSGQSGMIGFVSDEVASSPFAGRLLKGAQMRAWESGHIILSVDTFGERALEESAIDMMLSYRVLGVIYASMYHRVVEVPEALGDVPTVVVNAQSAGGRFSSVFPDEEEGGYTATSQLTGAGHRRIAYIDIQPADSDLPAGVGRRAGYRRALEEAGLTVDPRLVRHGSGGTVEDGLALTAELLDEADPPTAIFCGNDRTAWGAYRALEARGLRVPEDCSIVGFDDQETLASYLDPGLTTVALPHERMARDAVSLLLAEPREEPRPHPIHCSPVLRGSVTSAEVRA